MTKAERRPVGRLTEDGEARFRHWVLEGARRGESIPRHLLDDPAATETLSDAFEVEASLFATKFDLGMHICHRAGKERIPDLLGDDRVWPWFSLFYSDITMPEKQGIPFVGDSSRHLVARKVEWQNYDHAHRHLVRTAVQAVFYFSQNARVLLGKPHEHTKIEEQVLSRKAEMSIAYNAALVSALSILYWDEKNLQVARGAKSTGSGGIMRLVAVLRQLDVTHDVASLGPLEILDLLPKKEFGKWLQRRQ